MYLCQLIVAVTKILFLKIHVLKTYLFCIFARKDIIMNAKLTLKLNSNVIEKAKFYAFES